MSPSQEASPQFPRTSAAGLGRIFRVGKDRLEEAIVRLVAAPGAGDRAHANRFLAFAQQNRVNLDKLWSRQDERGRIDLTVLIVSSPGRTGMVFCSRAEGPQDAPEIGSLIDYACREAAGQEIDLAQALIDTDDTVDVDAFLRGGFTRLATLSYLERPLRGARAPEPPIWPPEVEVEPCTGVAESELLSVLNASYEATLDCPGLRGLRRTRDILEGHRSCGRHDPALWTLLRIDRQPAGVLMLNPSVGQNTVELVYLGLAPAARGRKLGTQLLRHGLRLLEGRKERSICLAVDEANAPALSVYRNEGFQPSLRRIALIRPLNTLPQ
jgi:ribosomal protein S18 acetylase RimI-like enzyme